MRFSLGAALVVAAAGAGLLRDAARMPEQAPKDAKKPVPIKSIQGYNRKFANDYFKRWGHWSTKKGAPKDRPYNVKPSDESYDVSGLEHFAPGTL
mmetsp:Transcript_23167/g.56355  ORF Transcript_23167/g.56355 Transcript_23167/m.56355 type:complete len:95 (+) Transcript_23167:53-337(+)